MTNQLIQMVIGGPPLQSWPHVKKAQQDPSSLDYPFALFLYKSQYTGCKLGFIGLITQVKY
jgi:hypothetical protein